MIIGREEEIKILEGVFYSKKAELMAVYGRRRIGKTFLIREYFSKQKDCIYLEISGIKDGSFKEQLSAFSKSLAHIFYNDAPLKMPANWDEAFHLLTEEIKKITDKKVVVFLDEFPWMATPRSKLIQYVDYYWNTIWMNISNLKVIICGSAASWILHNLINAQGGLYNRLTKILLLKPFNLATTKLFFAAKKCKFTNKQILDIYMVTGGVPFYLEYVQPNKSVVQNIHALCFDDQGILLNEFPRLFKSLFINAEICLRIIRTIATKRYGMARDELLHKIKAQSGGWINDRLEELEAAGFIVSYIPYERKKDVFYRVVDEYSLFYLRWLEPEIKKGHGFSKTHWHGLAKSQAMMSWAGYAFENVCLKHEDQIKKILHLQNIGCYAASWRFTGDKIAEIDGAQIDLLFDRNDDAITICEIKYVDTEKYKIDKPYAKNLENKINVFTKVTKTKKQIFLAMITVYGVEHNLYAEELVHDNVMLDDLFAVI